jgi:hypothetical protein
MLYLFFAADLFAFCIHRPVAFDTHGLPYQEYSLSLHDEDRDIGFWCRVEYPTCVLLRGGLVWCLHDAHGLTVSSGSLNLRD